METGESRQAPMEAVRKLRAKPLFEGHLILLSRLRSSILVSWFWI